jgi:deferrochelatase/peroxidase EfeB
MSPRRTPIAERGPGWSYRPDDRPPTIFGAHQPGIATPHLDHLALAAFDLTVERVTELRDLLAAWSAEAEALMCAGEGAVTLTLGLGPDFFEVAGRDRLGLRNARPVALRPLPPFDVDALDPAFCGGDVCVQACATDAERAASALERLSAAGRGAAVVRWRQAGSLRRRAGDRPGATPRGVLGFKEGTGNLRRGRDLDRHVWAGDRERSWMAGGTLLVVRRIRVLLDAWTRLGLDEQERVIGRHRDSGAPLGRDREFDPLPLAARTADGPVIPVDAHARLAARESNEGAVMLRRSYSYDTDAGAERDAGLVFLAYQRDPRRQYTPIQRRLASDALSAFTRHVGSAVFAVPPGARRGGFLGEGLFGR